MPDEATKQVGQIVDVLYIEYENTLKALPKGTPSESMRVNATKAQFLQALHDQFKADLITKLVKEKLPEEAAAGDPQQIKVRHILLKVPKPDATATPAAGGTPTVQPSSAVTPTATLVPSPTATLAPAQLDKAFQDRLPEAEAIYRELKDHPDRFAEIARQRSEDTASAVQGGELPPFGRNGQMVKPFEEAAFALKDDEISQPIRTQFGWHIIQRLPEDPAAKKERVQSAAYKKWLDGARASATVIPAPTPTATVPPTRPVPTPPTGAGSETTIPAEPATTTAP
ncbi:MAG: hypothetical protein NVSMB42_21000 [Herpetosiphon sp.]